MPEQQVNVHLQNKPLAQKYFLWSSWESRGGGAGFASIVHQSSFFFFPKVAPADMLPVLDDGSNAMYIHSDVNKTHEFLFDSSHYRRMHIYQI